MSWNTKPAFEKAFGTVEKLDVNIYRRMNKDSWGNHNVRFVLNTEQGRAFKVSQTHKAVCEGNRDIPLYVIQGNVLAITGMFKGQVNTYYVEGVKVKDGWDVISLKTGKSIVN